MAGDDFVARNGRERRGARDGNDRVARIARFLSVPVKSAAVTELVLELEEGDVLGRWARSDVESVRLPFEIDALLLDAANDRGTTVGAVLAWMADDKKHLSKGFRARCDKDEAETVRPLDGSMESWLQGAQRHVEVLVQQTATFTARSEERVERFLGIQERMIDKLLQHLDRSERLRVLAEEREQEAIDLADQAADAAESAAADAEAAAASKQDPFAQVIDIGVKQLMTGQGK
jgi:hypothetical protein